MKKKVITFAIDENELRVLKELAVRLYRSHTSLIREGLSLVFQKYADLIKKEGGNDEQRL
jgi:hypothetical protein